MNKVKPHHGASLKSDREQDGRPADGEVELDSVTLKRLLAEVRNEDVFEPASYNRLHNRHNRTR
jgi:hypothetical protein